MSEAKKVANEFEELLGKDIEGIKEALQHLSPASQIAYLESVLLKRKSFPKKTIEGVEKLLEAIAGKKPGDAHFEAGHFIFAAQAYKNIQEWELMGDVLARAMVCFQKIERLRTSEQKDDFLMTLSFFVEAAQEYEKGSLWNKAGNAWNKARDGVKAMAAFKKPTLRLSFFISSLFYFLIVPII